jgi:adenosylhomocysteine nucleosidase
VVDVATGARYPGESGGEWVLVTSQEVSDAADKRRLLTKYDADVVDMEAAAVAQVAQEHGIAFAAVKSISDAAEFVMPPLNRFIDDRGRFATGRFLVYLALHPQWWATMGKIRENSKIASSNLCRELEDLIVSSGLEVGS